MARYFVKEQELIEELTSELESVIASQNRTRGKSRVAMKVLSPNEKMNKANQCYCSIGKEIKGDREAKEEADALNEWLKLSKDESDLKKKLKGCRSSS
ncbi:MAG: hypothetical protein R2741_03505 [Methanolobus sp.]